MERKSVLLRTNKAVMVLSLKIQNMKKLKLNLQQLHDVEVLTREQLRLVVGGNQYVCRCNATYRGGAGYISTWTATAGSASGAAVVSMGTAGASACTSPGISAISCVEITTLPLLPPTPPVQ